MKSVRAVITPRSAVSLGTGLPVYTSATNGSTGLYWSAAAVTAAAAAAAAASSGQRSRRTYFQEIQTIKKSLRTQENDTCQIRSTLLLRV